MKSVRFCVFSVLIVVFLLAFSENSYAAAEAVSIIVKTPTDGGIREKIPKKYGEKYQKWKAELLSTGFGKSQWENYVNNKRFVLTITISDNPREGAKTDEYLWDEAGNFVGATIFLGNKADKGFPDPVYYPVMNSLSSKFTNQEIDGNILAAAKIAHELGHVNQTFSMNREVFLLQSELTPVYISYFLKNGHNARDRYLVNLAERMGGTPMEIWESREYWSEVNALAFIKERIERKTFYCGVFRKIKSNVEQYARDYRERFDLTTVSACGD